MLFVLFIIIGVTIACTLGLTIGVNFFGIAEQVVYLDIFYSVAALAIIDLIPAIIIRFLPKKWFNPESKLFKVYKWEKGLYLKLGVRHWKDKIPEAGKYLEGFSKSEVVDTSNNEYILQFIDKTIRGELMHFLGFVFSGLIAFIYPTVFVVIGLPLMLTNMLINILPVIVQRYNRPKLLLLYKRNLSKTKKDSK